MTTLRLTLVTIATLAFVSGCDEEDDDCTHVDVGFGGTICIPNPPPPPPPLPPPPPPKQPLGGVWTGTSSQGTELTAIITESGLFHLIDDLQTVGVGLGQVTTSDQVDASYTFVPAVGGALFDGSDFASCNLSGAITERVSLPVSLRCTTALGNTLEVAATLRYDTVYERGTDLATIAGDYDDDGAVLSIDSAGNIFKQDPISGCVYNGQITVIDPDYNVYGMDLTIGACVVSPELNGTRWSGFGTLDNTRIPEELLFSMTGDVTVGGIVSTIGLMATAPRL